MNLATEGKELPAALALDLEERDGEIDSGVRTMVAELREICRRPHSTL